MVGIKPPMTQRQNIEREKFGIQKQFLKIRASAPFTGVHLSKKMLFIIIIIFSF
jgi:hypothetical protein